MTRAFGVALAAIIVSTGSLDAGVSLRGSRTSMERQNRVAHEVDARFLRTSGAVWAAVSAGELVELRGDADYRLANVSYPFALPEVALFIERLSSSYARACGEPLVVTSLTRPEVKQPRNASDLSVHPAGMAVDLRVPARLFCRVWLENELLKLEAKDLLDVTKERRPPHYHVAVYPEAYGAHVEALIAQTADRAAAAPAPELEVAELTAVPAETAPDTPLDRRALLVLATLPLVVLVRRGRRRRG